MRVIQQDGNWHVVTDGQLAVAGPFRTNADAWRWLDRNTSEGGGEGDHAGRQDWSISQWLTRP